MENNLFSVDGKATINYIQPPQFIPESDKNDDWYKQNIRYYCTFYNNPKNNYDVPTRKNSGDPVEIMGEADVMRNNFAYYFGQQPNINYAFTTQDATGQTFQNPWLKGKHVAKILDFAKGGVLPLMSGVRWSATNLSKETVTDKAELINMIRMKFAMKQEMGQMGEAGAQFNPVDQEFEIQEEIDDYEQEMMDEGSEAGAAIASDIWFSTGCKYSLINAWLHTTIGGIGSIYNYVESGRVKKKFIPCYNRIWDYRADNDFGEGKRFGGFIEYLTPGEILSRPNWIKQWTAAEIKQLEGIARGQIGYDGFINYYNRGFRNLNWFNKGSEMLVACVTMFWIGAANVKWEKYKANKGDRYRMTDGKKLSEHVTDDLHMGTLIGNCFLVDHGLAPNVVRDMKNKGNPIIPISDYIPNMTETQTRPLCGMIKDNQDRIDFFENKIMELTGKDLGTVLLLYGEHLKNTDPLKIIDNLKDIGADVITSSGDRRMPGVNDTPIIQQLNLSQLPFIGEYVKLKQEQERTMEEIANFSKTATGMSEAYLSKDAQAGRIAASATGTAYLYEGFMQFVENDMRLAANMQKMIDADGSEETRQYVLGGKGVKFLKLSKGMRWQDVLIFMKIEDRIDEKAKAFIQGVVQQYATQPEIVSPIAVLEMVRAKTWTEMLRKIEIEMKKNIKKKEAREQYEKIMAMMQAERQRQASLEQEKIRQDGAGTRQVQDHMHDAAMKQGEQQQQVAA